MEELSAVESKKLTIGTWERWTFTNYVQNEWVYKGTEEDELRIMDLLDQPGNELLDNGIKAIEFQYECCPTTNRQHMQGWFELDKAKGFGFVKKLCEGIWWNNPHLERMLKSVDVNHKYCNKDRTKLIGPYLWGNVKLKQQGKRSDLDIIAHRIKSGASADDIMLEFPTTYLRMSKHIKDMVRDVYINKTKSLPKVIEDLQVHVLIGAAGTGKTRFVREQYDDDQLFISTKSNGKLWWDGYVGQPNILIEEFTGWIDIEAFLVLTDRYTKIRLEIKNSFTYSNWNKIYITSNIPVDEWYPDIPSVQKAALKRRITTTTIMN